MEQSQINKARRALFLMQVFSTLGFSILYGTLILYATQGLRLSDAYATAFVGGFIAFNYALHVLGGYVGGRLLSYRGLFVLGMVLNAAGCAAISIPHFYAFLWGAAIFLTGAGLNVICINCMLTQLFDPEDKRRESAFLWNYSGMNVGFFIGFSISGYFQLHQNYRALFLLAACGGLISFALALLNWRHLADRGTLFAGAAPFERKKRAVAAGCLVAALILCLSWLLRHAAFADALILCGGLLVAALFAYSAVKHPAAEGKKIWAFLVLALGGIIFWTLYQMAPMGLTLFFNRNVDPTLFGIAIPPQWMQNINTVIIILGGPTMAALYPRLRRKGYRISLPFQFTISLILIGVGFLILPLGIHFADSRGISGIGWVIAAYVFQSVAELFLSPIGYAMVGQLIPTKLQALAMGAWLMVTGVAAILSSYFSRFALGTAQIQSPLATNRGYSRTFLILGICSIVGGFFLWALRRFLHRLIQEKESLKAIEPAPYNAPQD